MRRPLYGLAIAVAMLVGAHPTFLHAEEGSLDGPIPTTGGIAPVLWGGGTIDQLMAASRAKGCAPSSVWVFSGGTAAGYVVGAPSFVSATFLAAFPSQIPPGTILVLICTAVPPSVATPAATDPSVLARQTFSPAGSGATYIFDETATTEYQTIIKGAVSASERYWGVSAPFTLYASSNADWVWEKYVQFVGATDPPSTLRKSYPPQAQICPPSGAGPVFGVAPPVAFGIFVCLGVGPTYSTQLIGEMTAHEHFHSIQSYLARSVIGSSPSHTPYVGPVWLIEGSALWSQLKIGLVSDAFSTGIALAVSYAGQAPYSLRCSESGAAYYSTTADPYRLGAAAVDLLLATKGQQAFLSYWSQLSSGTYWKTAFQNAFGVTIDSFYAAYDRMRYGEGRTSASC